MSNQPPTLKNSRIRPLVKLTSENRDAYEQLLHDGLHVWGIPEDYSFEEILSHMLRVEMGGPREERREELITILQMMDLSDIPE
jgi:hypothetical protein